MRRGLLATTVAALRLHEPAGVDPLPGDSEMLSYSQLLASGNSLGDMDAALKDLQSKRVVKKLDD